MCNDDLIMQAYKVMVAQLKEKYKQDMAKMNEIVAELLKENDKLKEKLAKRK